MKLNVVGLKMNLKVLSGQIQPAWEWYHVIGIEKDIDRYRFFYVFILILNIWWEFKVLSRFMQKWIQPPACLDHSLHVLKLRSSAKPFSKNAGETSIVLRITAGLWENEF